MRTTMRASSASRSGGPEAICSGHCTSGSVTARLSSRPPPALLRKKRGASRSRTGSCVARADTLRTMTAAPSTSHLAAPQSTELTDCGWRSGTRAGPCDTSTVAPGSSTWEISTRAGRSIRWSAGTSAPRASYTFRSSS